MAEAIGQVLSFGVGVALSRFDHRRRADARDAAGALQRARVHRRLGCRPGRRRTVVLLASGGAGASDQGAPAGWGRRAGAWWARSSCWSRCASWRGRPRAGEDAELPKWMQTIHTFKPGKAAAFGVLLSAVNPKNLLPTVGALTAAIAATGASSGSEAVALAIFILVATLGVGTPVVLYLALGERSKHTLDELKGWMGAHNAAIMSRALPRHRRQARRRLDRRRRRLTRRRTARVYLGTP